MLVTLTKKGPLKQPYEVRRSLGPERLEKTFNNTSTCYTLTTSKCDLRYAEVQPFLQQPHEYASPRSPDSDLSRNTTQRDVVAGGVFRNVDAVLEESFRAGLTRSGDTGISDDLIGSGLDDVFGVEVEELLVLHPLLVLLGVVIALPLVVPVLLAVGFVF
jgi:hypothetical protein